MEACIFILDCGAKCMHRLDKGEQRSDARGRGRTDWKRMDQEEPQEFGMLHVIGLCRPTRTQLS